jgi:hypothetical protein
VTPEDMAAVEALTRRRPYPASRTPPPAVPCSRPYPGAEVATERAYFLARAR